MESSPTKFKVLQACYPPKILTKDKGLASIMHIAQLIKDTTCDKPKKYTKFSNVLSKILEKNFFYMNLIFQ